MARRVELIAAALCSVAALLWLVYVIHVVQALQAAVGAGGQPFFHFNTEALALLYVVTATLILGVSVGAYLHVVYGRQMGAVMVWVCVALLIADLAAFDFSGWGMLPVPLLSAGLIEPAIWVGTAIPTVLPILEVLATSLGVVAVLASLAPAAAADQGRAPSGYPIPSDVR